MKAAEVNYAAVLREGVQKEITMLRRDIVQGMGVRAFLGPHAADVFRFRAQMKARLLEILQSVKQFGIEQVREELAKQ